MSNFEEVCRLSCENWIDSFPSDIPKHKFSKKHNSKMKALLQAENSDKKQRITKNTIKFLIMAAILLAIAATAFAIPASRAFIVEKFFDHSAYNVVDTGQTKKVESLEVNYIPNGFELDEEYKTDVFYVKVYTYTDQIFYVEKYELNTNIGFDTEKYNSESIKINGIDAIYYKSDNSEKGIIFNNGEYIFIISGNVDEEDLVKIAQNVI